MSLRSKLTGSGGSKDGKGGMGGAPDRTTPKNRYSSPPFQKQHQESPGVEAEMKPRPKWRGEQ